MTLDVSAFGALIKGFGDILHPKVGLSILAIMYRHDIHHDFIIFDNIIESFTHRPSDLNHTIQIFNFLPYFGYSYCNYAHHFNSWTLSCQKIQGSKHSLCVHVQIWHTTYCGYLYSPCQGCIHV